MNSHLDKNVGNRPSDSTFSHSGYIVTSLTPSAIPSLQSSKSAVIEDPTSPYASWLPILNRNTPLSVHGVGQQQQQQQLLNLNSEIYLLEVINDLNLKSQSSKRKIEIPSYDDGSDFNPKVHSGDSDSSVRGSSRISARLLEINSKSGRRENTTWETTSVHSSTSSSSTSSPPSPSPSPSPLHMSTKFGRRTSNSIKNENKINSKVNIRMSGKKASRCRLSMEATEYLTMRFKDNPRPSSTKRQSIAKELKLDERTIQVWFQNRRAKNKRERSLELKYSKQWREQRSVAQQQRHKQQQQQRHKQQQQQRHNPQKNQSIMDPDRQNEADVEYDDGENEKDGDDNDNDNASNEKYEKRIGLHLPKVGGKTSLCPKNTSIPAELSRVDELLHRGSGTETFVGYQRSDPWMLDPWLSEIEVQKKNTQGNVDGYHNIDSSGLFAALLSQQLMTESYNNLYSERSLRGGVAHDYLESLDINFAELEETILGYNMMVDKGESDMNLSMELEGEHKIGIAGFEGSETSSSSSDPSYQLSSCASDKKRKAVDDEEQTELLVDDCEEVYIPIQQLKMTLLLKNK